MADTKISDLTDGGSPRSADAFAVARSGANNKILGSSLDWISDEADAWTYASADAPTFTFTVSGDKTGELTVGKRIKLTQTTVKYFIITAVSYSAPNTTVTIYGGTDYTLANAAISVNHHSGLKAPAGFPLDPDKWTVETSDGSLRTQSSPVNGTWYNLGTISIVIPIGIWRVFYEVALNLDQSSTDTAITAFTTLSTANNTESDKDFTSFGYTADANAAGKGFVNQQHREKIISLAAKSTRYLNAMSNSGGSTLAFQGGSATTKIRAVCAYL